MAWVDNLEMIVRGIFGGVAATRKEDFCYREKKTEDSGMFPTWAVRVFCSRLCQPKKVPDQGNYSIPWGECNNPKECDKGNRSFYSNFYLVHLFQWRVPQLCFSWTPGQQ